MATDPIRRPRRAAAPPERRAARPATSRPRQWVRANLSPRRSNAALTVVAGLLVAWVVFRLARWVFVTADWEVVRVNLRLFMVGRFPADQLWRLWVAGYVVVVTVGVALGATSVAMRPVADGGRRPGRRPGTAGRSGRRAVGGPPPASGPRCWRCVVILGFAETWPPVVGDHRPGRARAWRPGSLGTRVPRRLRPWTWALVAAGLLVALQVTIAGEGGVGWDDWGGLHLAVAATVAGIALAFPLGLLLALGRRSSLPAIRLRDVGYIEAFRAVPAGDAAVPRPVHGRLPVPEHGRAAQLPRAGGHRHHAVRGRLHRRDRPRAACRRCPAARSRRRRPSGLSPVKVMRLVVLPQALRAVIPAMVGQFISLFKDTSLLTIIGFFELLEVAEHRHPATRLPGARGCGRSRWRSWG